MNTRTIATSIFAILFAVAAYFLYRGQYASSAPELIEEKFGITFANGGGICDSNSDCGVTTRECANGPDKTCSNTCSNDSCYSCSPAACDSPNTGGGDSNICHSNADCGVTTRECAYGPDKTCTNSCSNGNCRSCNPVACDTAPAPSQTCQQQGLCGGSQTSGCTQPTRCRDNSTTCGSCPAEPRCPKKTCADVQIECGTASDGCGGTLNCFCSGYDVCENKTCVAPRFCTQYEDCDNGIDDDCNGYIDERDLACKPEPQPTPSIHGQCGSAVGSCLRGDTVIKKSTSQCGQTSTWTCLGENGGQDDYCSSRNSSCPAPAPTPPKTCSECGTYPNCSSKKTCRNGTTTCGTCPSRPAPTPTPQPIPQCGDYNYHIQPGGRCDDGNSNTTGDAYNNNCRCVGSISIPQCGDKKYHIQPGQSCDDWNANTIKDTYNNNCQCVGTPKPIPQCGDYDYHIQPGQSCDDRDPSTIYDTYNNNCQCVGTPKPIPQCGDKDYNILPGEWCDDRDPNTKDDRYNSDCRCEGTPISYHREIGPRKDCTKQYRKSNNVCDQSGNRDRDVTCEDEYGNAVSNHLCKLHKSIKPIDTEVCVIYTDGNYCRDNSGLDAACRDGICVSIDPCEDRGGDTDGDGICDAVDNCRYQPNTRQLDTDDDGIGNDCDTIDPDPIDPCEYKGGDSDRDGKCDFQDNCPDAYNPKQADSDGDGTGDICEPIKKSIGPCNDGLSDLDHDGVCDREDNCVRKPNRDQRDSDRDGRGDACEKYEAPPVYHPPYDQKKNYECEDYDNDGICNYEDSCPDNYGFANNSGCPIIKEDTHLLSPICVSQGGDADHDGVCDRVDVCPNQHGMGNNNGCYGYNDQQLDRQPNFSYGDSFYNIGNGSTSSGGGGTTRGGYQCKQGTAPNGYGGCTLLTDPFWEHQGTRPIGQA